MATLTALGAAPATSGRRVCVPDVDLDLLDRLSPDHAQAARRLLIARAERIPAGAWRPDAGAFGAEGAIGLLITSGLALRRVALAHRTGAELLGPGDLLRPWQDDGAPAAYPFSSTWRVLEPLELAVLDAAFAARLARFPELIGELVGRGVARSRRLIGHLVVGQLTAVDQRLLVAFWHLADRWGRVRPDGVVVPVRLTHESLGQIVGARRPSVTAALGRLAERGLVVGRPGGGWLLQGPPPEEFVSSGRDTGR